VRASLKKRVAAQGMEPVFPVTENKSFVIVIPSYNNEKWVEKNLGSALAQEYDHFRIIYIDDASTDHTLEKAKELIKRSPNGFRVTLIHNPENRGAAENFYRTLSACQMNEIALILDGDDWLAHDGVLRRLNEIYANPDVWYTCGTYVEYPSYSYTIGKYAGKLPVEVIETNSYRKYFEKTFPLSHLKTFYVSLFHQIKDEDFLFEGKFFDAAPDQMLIIPIAEMAGTHYRHIKDILYIYNRATLLNEDKVRWGRQRACGKEVRSRTPYLPLKELPQTSQERRL
jgi:glycosyltransferase involved in cell wall biosynthesis